MRKANGLSQEELAVKLNVVRQTISKWEKGLIVPDSEILILVADALKTSVYNLLGETISKKSKCLEAISEKLEIINLQFAKINEAKRKSLYIFFVVCTIITILIFVILFLIVSSYFIWNYSNIEMAIIGTNLHIFEWIFARVKPLLLCGFTVVILTRRNK